MFEYIVDRRQEGATLLRKMQLTELYLLEVFDEICCKHKLSYFLIGGTLIGAMRHNGFIPWDDDIDIGMPMSDYRKFCKIVRNELPRGVDFVSGNEAYAAAPFAKLRDKNSFIVDRWMLASAPNGIFIDIFPFVGMPRLPYQVVYAIVRLSFGSYRRWRSSLLRARSSVLAAFVDCVCAAFWKSLNVIFKAIWRILVVALPSGHWHIIPESGFPNRARINQYLPVQMHTFEGRLFPIPADYEAVLRSEYSNWRELPPESDRKRHASICVPNLND